MIKESENRSAFGEVTGTSTVACWLTECSFVPPSTVRRYFCHSVVYLCTVRCHTACSRVV